MLAAALCAAALRWALLLDDPWAHGYDGWYYVLQVRSLRSGEALFSDRSLVFPFLTVLSQLTGDVILGNKLAACLFASVAAAGGAVCGWRWTGRLSAAVVVGGWWALSPLHLGVSAEFLKNSAGVAVLSLFLAALPRCERRRRQLAAVLFFALLGPLVHKLTGLLGILTGLSYAAVRLVSGRALPRWLWILACVGVLCVLAVGVLRPEDLQRFWSSSGGTATRWSALWSARLVFSERVELVAVHLAPLALLVGAWGKPHLRPLGLALLPLSVVSLAPGLPFGWDLTAWRLLLVGFLGAGLGGAVLVSRAGRASPLLAGLLVLAGLAQAPPVVEAVQKRSPDYASWAEVVPLLRATIPSGSRVIAHRGLCGFIWAEADILCENFQPPPPHAGWWRVAYGFGPRWFAPHLQAGEPPPIEVLPGYTLVWEPHWQRFCAAEGGEFLLTQDPRNPFRARPSFVYGPNTDSD